MWGGEGLLLGSERGQVARAKGAGLEEGVPREKALTESHRKPLRGFKQ